jgi:Uma2 family endonuclease
MRYHGVMSMTALPQTRMTAEEFLAWSQGQPGRYELADGEVIAQAAERVAHAEMKGNLYVALRDAIRRKGLRCRALPDGVAVRVSQSTVFEPDAQVYCGPELSGDALLVEPLIVVEVVSPSTGRNDLTGKLEGYFRLPSIEHYLIVYPDKPLIIHHARSDGETILTRIIRDGAVTLDPPGLEFAMAEIYEAGARDGSI